MAWSALGKRLPASRKGECDQILALVLLLRRRQPRTGRVVVRRRFECTRGEETDAESDDERDLGHGILLKGGAFIP